MDYRNEINPPPLLKPLTTLERTANMSLPQPSVIDPDKAEAYSSLEDVPAEALEATLKTVRTIRKLAISRGDYQLDVHLGTCVIAVMVLIARYNQRVKIDELYPPNSPVGDSSDAPTATSPPSPDPPQISTVQ